MLRGRSTAFAVFALMISGLLWGPQASAGDIMAYPAKGQSPETQQRDEYECYAWAKQKSGYDPARPPPQTAQAPAPQPQGQRHVIRGAARGAAVGTVVGAIKDEDDLGDSALAGAAGGALIGGFRRRDQRRARRSQNHQQQQQVSAQYDRQRDDYNRALAVCMEARGYVVR
jgi:hypothetical protein